MTLQEIRERLLSMQDQKYRDFQVKLIPSVPPETVIGVRTPDLRKLAKELQADGTLRTKHLCESRPEFVVFYVVTHYYHISNFGYHAISLPPMKQR